MLNSTSNTKAVCQKTAGSDCETKLATWVTNCGPTSTYASYFAPTTVQKPGEYETLCQGTTTSTTTTTKVPGMMKCLPYKYPSSAFGTCGVNGPPLTMSATAASCAAIVTSSSSSTPAGSCFFLNEDDRWKLLWYRCYASQKPTSYQYENTGVVLASCCAKMNSKNVCNSSSC